MLIGASALLAPIIIHLIARHRYPVKDFPSIYLLRYERRDNAFARRLIDPLQLLLRLIVLALLVLAMSRLFSPTASDEPAPHNLVVVVDGSASMRMQAENDEDESVVVPFETARNIARDLLAEIQLPSRCALIRAGEAIETLAPLGPDPQPALVALEEMQPGDGTGPGLIRAIAESVEMVRGRREVKSQIVVITDRFAGAFESRHQGDMATIESLVESMGDQLDVVIVDVSTGEAENLAIILADLRGGRVRIGDDAHVVTRVKNLGMTNQVAKLAMIVGGRKEAPFRNLVLEPGDEVVADLTSRVKRSLRGFATVTLDNNDAVPHDDLFTIPFVVEPSRRILVVNGVSIDETADIEASTLAGLSGGGSAIFEEEEVIDGARILQYALNPGRELGLAFGTGLDTIQITPDALPAQTLSKYDAIILYDVSKLSDQSVKDLDVFVSEGRSLLIIASGDLNPIEFNGNLASARSDAAAVSPVRFGKDINLDPPAAVRFAPVATDAFGEGVTYQPGPWLAPFRHRGQGDLGTIRFRTIREIREIEPGANVLMQVEGRPLAIEAARGRGKVVVLTFGLELGRGNIAMTKVFPILVWRLMDYLGGRLHARPPDTLVAAAPAALDASEMAFSLTRDLELARALEQPRAVEVEDIAGTDTEGPLELTVNDQSTVFVDSLDAGNYWLKRRGGAVADARAGGYRRPVTVNPDPRESRMERPSDEDLQKLLGENIQLLKGPRVAGLAPTGMELWRWLIMGLVAAYLLEAIIAYITGAIRDKRQEALEAEDQADAPDLEETEAN